MFAVALRDSRIVTSLATHPAGLYRPILLEELSETAKAAMAAFALLCLATCLLRASAQPYANPTTQSENSSRLTNPLVVSRPVIPFRQSVPCKRVYRSLFRAVLPTGPKNAKAVQVNLGYVIDGKTITAAQVKAAPCTNATFGAPCLSTYNMQADRDEVLITYQLNATNGYTPPAGAKVKLSGCYSKFSGSGRPWRTAKTLVAVSDRAAFVLKLLRCDAFEGTATVQNACTEKSCPRVRRKTSSAPG